MKKADILRAVALLILLAAAVAGLIVLSVNEPLGEALGESLGQFRGSAWGPVVFAVVYALAYLIIPGSLITLAAGSLFGVVVGTAVVFLASVTGACRAFGLGRTLARGLVEKRLAGNPRFRALDQAVAAGGFKIVLLTRLSPLFPFTLLIYAFGLTKVRFRDYALASWIGMLPGTVRGRWSVTHSRSEGGSSPYVESGSPIGPRSLKGAFVMTSNSTAAKILPCARLVP